ncbi:MAG: hypothetical protein ABI068_00375 [Ktedonobacterales bacterium]
MRTFNTVWNIIYLCFGVFSILLGLVIILGAALTQDGSSIFYGVILLAVGAFRIFWSIYRMRMYARFNAAQNAQLKQGYNPYAPPPVMYPPQQAQYPQPQYPPQQYGGQYPPQPGQYGPYGQPGQAGQPSVPMGAYPPQPGQYTGQYPPQSGGYPPQYPQQ